MVQKRKYSNSLGIFLQGGIIHFQNVAKAERANFSTWDGGM
jgi:hypothetical protein